MSFLQRLKGEGVDTEKLSKEEEKKKEEALAGVQQVAIDLVEATDEIIIFADLAGAAIHDTRVKVEGDNDIVIIQGERKRPEHLVTEGDQQLEGKFFAEDIRWGEFYRKVILPEPVDVKRANVRLKRGVLIIQLPMLKAREPESHELTIQAG